MSRDGTRIDDRVVRSVAPGLLGELGESPTGRFDSDARGHDLLSSVGECGGVGEGLRNRLDGEFDIAVVRAGRPACHCRQGDGEQIGVRCFECRDVVGDASGVIVAQSIEDLVEIVGDRCALGSLPSMIGLSCRLGSRLNAPADAGSIMRVRTVQIIPSRLQFEITQLSMT